MRGDHLEQCDAVLYRQSEGPIEIHLAEPAPLLVDGDLLATSRYYKFEVLRHRIQYVVATNSAESRAQPDV